MHNLPSKVSGWLLFTTLILTLASVTTRFDVTTTATLTAWAFVLIEFIRLKSKQKIQIVALCTIGLAFSVWAWSAGSHHSLVDLLKEHLRLAMLLAAVNFIRLAATLERQPQSPGQKQFLLTLGGMHLFSSVANFSSLLLVGDQLKRHGRLDLISRLVLARAFSLAVLWSPFLSILPLVLEQVPNSHIQHIYPFTLFLTLFGLSFTWLELRWRQPQALSCYQGYPMTSSSIELPLLMMAGIVFTSWLFPQQPIIGLVSALAMGVPLLLLTRRQGVVHATQRFIQHIRHDLSEARAEVTLFLSAGFLAAAVKACVSAGLISLSITETNALIATLVMWTIVILAYLGIHQFALVAIFIGLLAEVTTTPTLMALAYIIATSVSMSGSAFSGVNFILQSRFQAEPRQVVGNNLAYTGVLLLITSALLFFIESFGVA